jgi:hypothetical protein
MTTMIEKNVEIVNVEAMTDAKKSVEKVSAEKAIIGSPKAALPKGDDHSPDVQKLIVLTAPDVIRAPASTSHSQNTKGRLIRVRRNMESSHLLRMVRRARVDFILR